MTSRLQNLTENKIYREKHRYELLAGRLTPAFAKLYEQKKNQVDNLVQALLLMDISKIKARGFSLVTTHSGKIIKSVNDVQTGDQVNLELSDGTVRAEIK